MATKKKSVVKEKETKVEVKKDFTYVSEFFKVINDKIKELKNDQKEAQNTADSYDESIGALASIKSDMVDLFDKQGVPDVAELAYADEDYEDDYRW